MLREKSGTIITIGSDVRSYSTFGGNPSKEYENFGHKILISSTVWDGVENLRQVAL